MKQNFDPETTKRKPPVILKRLPKAASDLKKFKPNAANDQNIMFDFFCDQ
jgi:hypothetical protein